MPQTADISCLTPLEREIVELVGQGFRDWHIDETLWMTRQTLSAHLRSIFDKLGVADQTELAQLAVRLTPAVSRR
jgi:DNA-binding CsgD family transcriptional regulator